MTLNQLKSGQTGQIKGVKTTNPALVRQCDTLGLELGATVHVLFRSGASGPMQVKCSGTLYAIRPSEAAHIEVNPV